VTEHRTAVPRKVFVAFICLTEDGRPTTVHIECVSEDLPTSHDRVDLWVRRDGNLGWSPPGTTEDRQCILHRADPAVVRPERIDAHMLLAAFERRQDAERWAKDPANEPSIVDEPSTDEDVSDVPTANDQAVSVRADAERATTGRTRRSLIRART